MDRETDIESVSISPADDTDERLALSKPNADTTTTSTTKTNSTIYIFDVHHSIPIIVYDQLTSIATSMMFFSEGSSNPSLNGLVIITASKEVLHLSPARSHRRYSLTDSLMEVSTDDSSTSTAVDNHHHQSIDDVVSSASSNPDVTSNTVKVPYLSGKVGAKVAKVLNQSIADPLAISASTYDESSTRSSFAGHTSRNSSASMNQRQHKVMNTVM